MGFIFMPQLTVDSQYNLSSKLQNVEVRLVIHVSFGIFVPKFKG